MDPFSLSTGVVGLVAVALQLVVGTLGLIDKTATAYNEAADELKGLQQDLEQLQTRMSRIHGALNVLLSNTKDRGFKKLLRNDHGQAAVRELCKALEMTLSTLTEMTDRMDESALRPAPLPANKKSLGFIRAVLKHSIMPSKIADLVKSLREMRSDVQTCVTKLEATFQHVHTLYDMMRNGLTSIASRTSLTSTSTNLTVRIKLAAWLKRWEGTWRPFRQPESTSLRGFLEPQHVAIAGNSHVADDLIAGNSQVLQSEQVTDATGALAETSNRALEDLGRIINDAMDDLAQSANEYAHLSLSGSFSTPLEKAILLLERQCKESEEKGVDPEQLEKVRGSLEEMKGRFGLLRKAQENVAVAKGVQMLPMPAQEGVRK